MMGLNEGDAGHVGPSIGIPRPNVDLERFQIER
jgi:hypothetical protein